MTLWKLSPLVLVFSLVSCGAGLWNLPPTEVRQKLEAGDYSFFTSLSDDEVVGADLSSLGPGAWYYSGFVLAKIHRPLAAERLWHIARERERSPWNTLAAREELKSARERKDWPVAEDAARWLLRRFPQDLSLQRELVTALYWQKLDREAWKILTSWPPKAFSRSQERENLLYKAVLAVRLGYTDEASKALKTLIFDTPAALLSYRVYSFLEEDPRRYALLGPEGHWAAFWQSMAGQEMAQEAEKWLSHNANLPAFWRNPIFITEVGSLFRTPSLARPALTLLDKLPEAKGALGYSLAMAKGELYEALSYGRSAEENFHKAQSLAQNSQEWDRASWNYLAAKAQRVTDVLGDFEQILKKTRQPAYYSDVLSSWMAQLASQRDWRLLARVYRDLSPYLVPDDEATVDFLLASLARHEMLNLREVGIHETIRDLLLKTITLSPFSYESLMARAILGQALPLDTRPNIDATLDERYTKPLPEGPEPPVGQWVKGFFRFGLAREAGTLLIRVLGASSTEVSPGLVRETASKLQEKKEYKTSLLLMDAAVAKPGYPTQKRDWELLFPRAWPALMDTLAKKNHVDASLLTALIRVESSFDPKAKSWVGATGLSQLMPSTARGVARELRLKVTDLEDPETNLTLGARYLGDLLRDEKKAYLALMAYNAGYGRVASWRRTLGSLPEEIFVEAVPFSETRYYVKKVLRSAVMYGILYHQKTLPEMVRLIYPEFRF